MGSPKSLADNRFEVEWCPLRGPAGHGPQACLSRSLQHISTEFACTPSRPPVRAMLLLELLDQQLAEAGQPQLSNELAELSTAGRSPACSHT